jgi:hypothetical protein
MRPLVALVVVLPSACSLFEDTDRGFRVEGHIEGATECILKVSYAKGASSFEPREVRGDFYEFYGVGPVEQRYAAALWCGGKSVASQEFVFGRNVDLGGTVNLGKIKL